MPIYMKIEGIKGDVTPQGWARIVELSRISLSGGGSGVDAQEALPTRKAAELFERAGSAAPSGKLYVATDAGVFNKDPIEGRGRLVVGSDQGIFSRGGLGGNGALKNVSGNNTWLGASRPGMGVLKSSDGGKTWSSTSRPMKWDNVTNTQWSGSVPVVEIFVSDRGSATGRSFRLKDVTVTPAANGGLELSYLSAEF